MITGGTSFLLKPLVVGIHLLMLDTPDIPFGHFLIVSDLVCREFPFLLYEDTNGHPKHSKGYKNNGKDEYIKKHLNNRSFPLSNKV